MPEVTPEQVGSAAVYLTDRAGIAATILAFVSIGLAAGLVWAVRTCRQALKDADKAWGARFDQLRGDIKEAFGQNAAIADRVVNALHALQMEIARLSAKRD